MDLLIILQRFGVWGDWEDPYLTLSPDYEAAQVCESILLEPSFFESLVSTLGLYFVAILKKVISFPCTMCVL
jgi:hypothetical protein